MEADRRLAGASGPTAVHRQRGYRCVRFPRESLSARMLDQPDADPPKPPETPPRRLMPFVSGLLVGQVKLPALPFLVLAIVIGVPDWNSRYQFWLQAAKSSGGLFGTVATLLLLPGASAAIAVIGLLLVVAFEVRDRRLARSGPSVAFAWASLVACVAAVGCTAIYGYVQVYIKREIAAGIAGLPRGVPNLADPSRAQRPLTTANRFLMPDQQRILLEVLPKLKPLLPSIAFVYDQSDYEPLPVMQSYQKVFARSGIFTTVMQRQPAGPEDTGIRIVVGDLRHVDEAAQELKRDLELADVLTTFEQWAATPQPQANVPLAIHIAPAPLL